MSDATWEAPLGGGNINRCLETITGSGLDGESERLVVAKKRVMSAERRGLTERHAESEGRRSD